MLRRRAALAAALLLVLAGGAASAGTAPSRMMANVFRLSEAGAVLQVCFASDAFKALPAQKAARLKDLGLRLARVVESIGRYYDDGSLPETYEATRDRIAGESRLRLHVKNYYQYCGDRLASEMEAYVAENEALLGTYFAKPRPPRNQQKAPPREGPPRSAP